MIDLEKLREKTQECYGVVMISESEFIALLDYSAQLEKDAGRLDWLESSKESHGFCHVGDGEFRYYAHQTDGYKSVRQAIDTAMESKHG